MLVKAPFTVHIETRTKFWRDSVRSHGGKGRSSTFKDWWLIPCGAKSLWGNRRVFLFTARKLFAGKWSVSQ